MELGGPWGGKGGVEGRDGESGRVGVVGKRDAFLVGDGDGDGGRRRGGEPEVAGVKDEVVVKVDKGGRGKEIFKIKVHELAGDGGGHVASKGEEAEDPHSFKWMAAKGYLFVTWICRQSFPRIWIICLARFKSHGSSSIIVYWLLLFHPSNHNFRRPISRAVIHSFSGLSKS